MNPWVFFTKYFSKTILHPQYFLKQYEHNAIEEALRHAKGTVIDIGCGRQPYRNLFVSKIEKYIGVDHPQTSVIYKGGIRPDIFADATNVPIENSSADLIMMISVLEHLPQPQKAIDEAYRLNKSNGTFIAITVQNYPIHDTPYDYFRYSKFGLSNIIKKAGYKIEKEKSFGNFFILSGQMLNVFMLYQIKNGLKKNFTIKIISLTLIPIVFTTCLISNVISLLLSGILKSDKNGTYAIYNMAVAKKT